MSIKSLTPKQSSLQIDRQVVVPFTSTRERAVPECLFEIGSSAWMLAYNDHCGVADESVADICSIVSHDDGETWSAPTVLVSRGDHVNVVAPSLLTLQDGRIGMSYLGFDGYESQHFYYQTCDAHDGPWSQPVRITRSPGFHGNAGMRLLQLRSGRLLQPVCWAPYETDEREAVYRVYVWYSDDGGQHWESNPHAIELPKRGGMEPVVVELHDGGLRMFIRNQLGYIYQCVSSDEGMTWTKPEPTTLVSPESCCFLSRIKATGDLIVLWNHSVCDPSMDHMGSRCPLSVAVSQDEGESWSAQIDIETDSNYTYSMPVAAFSDEWAMFAYYLGHDSQSSGRVEGVFSRCTIEHLYQALRLPIAH